MCLKEKIPAYKCFDSKNIFKAKNKKKVKTEPSKDPITRARIKR